jgi:DNA repair exonuclease SbcCD nuclease subunit
MDLILLGHIHKRDEYYAGSLCSLGFDEPGEHGFYYGEITKKSGKLESKREFVRADSKEFVNTELDVSNINDEDELVEKINLYNEENKYYELHLVGSRKFSIDIDMNIINKNIIKIKDDTELSKEIELKPNDKTLTGIFVKKLNEKLEAGEVTKEEYDKMLEGLLESLK